MRAAAAVALIAVVACSKLDGTQALIDGGRARVKAELRDPESARFRKASVATVKRSDGSEMRVACGYVNAKNGFGGYVGDELWYAFELPDKSVGVCLDLKDCIYTRVSGVDPPQACAASLGE